MRAGDVDVEGLVLADWPSFFDVVILFENGLLGETDDGGLSEGEE